MKPHHYFLVLVCVLAVVAAGAVLATTVLVDDSPTRFRAAIDHSAIAELEDRVALAESEVARLRDRLDLAQLAQPSRSPIGGADLEVLRLELREEFTALLARELADAQLAPDAGPTPTVPQPGTLEAAVDRVLEMRAEREAQAKLDEQIDRTRRQLESTSENVAKALAESLSLSANQENRIAQVLTARRQRLEQIYQDFYTAQRNGERYDFNENRKPIEDDAVLAVRQALSAQQQVSFDEQLGQGTLDHIGWRYQRGNRQRNNRSGLNRNR